MRDRRLEQHQREIEVKDGQIQQHQREIDRQIQQHQREMEVKDGQIQQHQRESGWLEQTKAMDNQPEKYSNTLLLSGCQMQIKTDLTVIHSMVVSFTRVMPVGVTCGRLEYCPIFGEGV